MFLTEPEPPRHAALPVAPGIHRIVAPNPGPMTYWGTNTYLVAEPGGNLVLDPGPHDAGHLAAILAALTPHPRTSRAITAELYADVDPRLLRAAERNVIAHLDKLRGEGRVRDVPEGWMRA